MEQLHPQGSEARYTAVSTTEGAKKIHAYRRISLRSSQNFVFNFNILLLVQHGHAPGDALVLSRPTIGSLVEVKLAQLLYPTQNPLVAQPVHQECLSFAGDSSTIQHGCATCGGLPRLSRAYWRLQKAPEELQLHSGILDNGDGGTTNSAVSKQGYGFC